MDLPKSFSMWAGEFWLMKISFGKQLVSFRRQRMSQKMMGAKFLERIEEDFFTLGKEYKKELDFLKKH